MREKVLSELVAGDMMTSPSESISSLPRFDGSGLRVRIIDDDQMCRELMCEVMQFSYMETDSRGSAQEALDLMHVSSHDNNITVMDIHMPDQKRVSAFRKDSGGHTTISQSSQ